MIRRNLGEAVSPGEQAIEAALADIMTAPEAADWRGRAIAYEPVSGGISNANWRILIEGHARSYFVKLPGANTETFIDRAAAWDASRKAHAAGVGAEALIFRPQTGVMVTEFVEGLRTSMNGDFLNPTVRTNVARALRAFNDGAPIILTKTLFDMIDEHVEQALSLGGHFPHDFGWLNQRYRQARAALEASGLDLVPCMNDTLAANFLLTDDNQVMLVDFDYASNNDRCAELSVWLGEMFFPPQAERAALEAYFGSVDDQILARISLFKAIADFKWSTWAMVQDRVSHLDFDYIKYGVWKHMRARMYMSDPQWDMWLKRA